MNRIILDSKPFTKSESFRSISSSNLTKSVYIGKSTRNLNSKKITTSTLARSSYDYLSMISPKSDISSSLEVNDKEAILDSHMINEILSNQEIKRNVIPNQQDLNLSQDFSLLLKMSNEFRYVEAKVRHI